MLGIAPDNAHGSTIGAVSLTFDDGLTSQYQYAAPILKDAGQTATLFVPTGLIGTEGYMTWDHVARMVIDGWEMGGHSVSHSELPTITPEEFQYEIEESFNALVRNGLIPMSFATPYGAHSPEIIANIATYFQSHRGFHEVGFNRWPFNEYLLYVQQVTNQTTVEQVEGWIQEAMINNDWLIIVFHGIQPVVQPEETYVWSTENLQALMVYLNTNNIQTKTIAEMLNMKVGIIPNSDFEQGIANGWTTDNPVLVVEDSSNNGSVPNPLSSIKITGSDTASNLLSPTVSLLDGVSDYGVRVYVNAAKFVSGEFGFYIDEYDRNVVWI
jgi:peptidoglycan/xylan/chitin deacetylase (PgdA/CDA1 family)